MAEDSVNADSTYRPILDAIDAAVFVVDITTRHFIEANQCAIEWLGHSREDLLQMTSHDIVVGEFDAEQETQALKQLPPGQHLVKNCLYRAQSGLEIPAEVSSRLFTHHGVTTILCTVRDSCRSKRAEPQQTPQPEFADALRDAAAALNSTLKLTEVSQRILPHVARVIPGQIANVMLIEGDIGYLAAQWGYESLGVDLSSLVGRNWNLSEIKEMRWVVENRRPLMIPDTQTSPHWTTIYANWARSYIGAPIIVNDQVIGIIHLDHREPNRFTEAHADHLLAFANQAGIAIQNARLHEDVQRAAKNLELRVHQRTQELEEVNRTLAVQMDRRQQAEADLEQERNLLRTLIDHIPDEIYVKSSDGRVILANKALTGRIAHRAPNGEVIGSTDFDYVDEAKARQFQQGEQAIISGETLTLNEEVRVLTANHQVSWRSVIKVPLRDPQGEVMGLVGINRDITEIKQAEERLHHIISGANCLFWYAVVTTGDDDMDWDFYIPNLAAAQNFLPLSAEDEQAFVLAWRDSVLPQDRRARDDAGEDAIRGGQTEYDQSYRCCLPDGEIRWIHEDAQVRRLIEGRYSVVGICTDITERKQAEETLKNANERLEQAVAERTAELSAANQHLQQQIVERERAQSAERMQRLFAEALSGAARALSETLELSEVLDRILTYAARVVPPHQNASVMLIEEGVYVRTLRVRDYMDVLAVTTTAGGRFYLDNLPTLSHILETNRPLIVNDTQTDPLWRHDSKQSWMRSYVGVPIHVEGKVIGFLNVGSVKTGQFTPEHAERLVAFSDQAGAAIQNAQLFEATQAQASLLSLRVIERTHELDHERAQLRAILDAITDGVIFHNDQNVIQYINQALTDLTGYTSKEWLQDPNVWSRLTGWEEARAQHQAVTVSNEVLRHGIWDGEFKFRRKNGEEFDARAVSTSVVGFDGNPAGLVTVIRDISAAKRLEEQRARFISTVSHELRTPIANIKTRLYLLKKQPEKMDTHLDVVSTVTDSMSKLVNDLLDISRFQYGVITLKRKNLILQDLIRTVIQVQQPEAGRKQVSCSFHPSATTVTINADLSRMTQVITNLLTNAIHYTPAGGKITVKVATETVIEADVERSFAVITVCDTGPGIPKEALSEIFKPFFRVSDYEGGMGLGLSITREIVELHGGQIEAFSEDDGACFVVKLPAVSNS